MGAGHKGRGWLVGVATITLALLPGTAGATEWCIPATTRLAYDALLTAAPDGSDLEAQARRSRRRSRPTG